ncbi:PRELI domain-containing protein 1, mitochondrial-like [Rhopilema esculentum]|uniref:PRELI domain-containing protein 1, mitochondrial-like n=1 Tax=Rhopilema esculentum TaxID=499914 RepID=UPI0031E2AC34
MRCYTTGSNIRYTWDQVSAAFHKRYPNPWSKHVLTEDVVSRCLEGTKLKTTKLISKTNRLPKWGEKFVSNPTACIVEESIVDPVNKTLITYTRNITYQKLMVVEEKCEYTKSSDCKDWTLCSRQAWITSKIYGFSRPIEAFGVERYKNNIQKSRKGLEYVLEKMFNPEKLQTVITGIPLTQNF